MHKSTGAHEPCLGPAFVRRRSFTHICTYVCVCMMYVCMYVCMYACMHACMYVCMYVYVFVCMYVCMNECIYIRMYACMYVCMYVCMHATCAQEHKCTCINVYPWCIHGASSGKHTGSHTWVGRSSCMPQVSERITGAPSYTIKSNHLCV